MLFILEYGMIYEDIILYGNEVWLNLKEENNVWGDISLIYLLIYNICLDEYKYEIKEFNCLIKGIDFLNVVENILERDKLKYYEDRFKLVLNIIMIENEDILVNILKERKLKKVKMLYKVLVCNKLKIKLELDEEKYKEN